MEHMLKTITPRIHGKAIMIKHEPKVELILHFIILPNFSTAGF